MSSITKNANFLEFSKTAQKDSKVKRIKARAILELLALIVAIATLVATVATLQVSKNTYNSRYDADATVAGGLTFTFAANGKDTASGSFTASVGTVTYGYFQTSGSTPTQYTLKYKKSTSSSYSTLKSFTVYSNNNYTGTYTLATIKNSTKYDIKCVKNSNKTTKSVLEFDWGIE